MISSDSLEKERDKLEKLSKKLKSANHVVNYWTRVLSNPNNILLLNTDIAVGIYALNYELGSGACIPKEVVDKHRDSILAIMKDTVEYYEDWIKKYEPIKNSLIE